MSNTTSTVSGGKLPIIPDPINISRSLFMSDEKVAEDRGSNLKAFINQSRISTYYQDNPFGTLSFSGQFSLPAMGGQITQQPSGHRPGNLFMGTQVLHAMPAFQMESVKTKNLSGIVVPKNMARW